MTEFKEYKHDVAITDDTELVDAVPPGFMIETLTFVNSTANEATIDCGSTSGGSDIFSQATISASGITSITVNKVISMSDRKSLFLNDDGVGTWNSSSVIVLVHMKRSLL